MGLTSQVVVPFGDEGGKAGIVMEGSNKEPENVDEKFFRVYGGGGYTLAPSSGTIVKSDVGLRRFASEFLFFQGSRFAALKYPDADVYTLRILGTAANTQGDDVTPDLNFDASKNAVASDIGFYGVVLCEYTTLYDLWRAKFAGVCPSVNNFNIASTSVTDTGSPEDDQPYEGRHPMVVYARKGGIVEESLVLDPPECIVEDDGGNQYVFLFNEETQLPSLFMEFDDKYPLRLIKGSKLFPEAGGRIRIYPDVDTTLVATSGTVGTVRRGNTRVVKQAIAFNGTSTVTLPIPPMNSSVLINAQGAFVDEFGRTFDPDFVPPGSTVNSVVRSSRTTISQSQNRDVLQGEIVVTDHYGNTVNCYGVATAEYTASYSTVEYKMEYDLSNKRFLDSFVLATGTFGSNTVQGVLAAQSPRAIGDY